MEYKCVWSVLPTPEPRHPVEKRHLPVVFTRSYRGAPLPTVGPRNSDCPQAMRDIAEGVWRHNVPPPTDGQASRYTSFNEPYYQRRVPL